MKVLVKALGWLVAVVVGLLALSAGTNLALTTLEKSQNPPPGPMVAVGEHRLHVLSQGSGSHRVVLLPGLGTPSPVLDFAPLTEALQGDFSVTVIEPFGYGWSDFTDEKRTVDALVEETRQALRGAGVAPPYLLVPHSIAGLYVLRWAQMYPEEIEGVVGLDTTVPEQAAWFRGPTGFNFDDLWRNLGLVRWVLAFTPDAGDARARQRAMVAGWTAGNPVMEDQYRQAGETMRSLADDSFPANLPVTFVLSQQTVDGTPLAMPGMDWLAVHQRLIADNPNGRVVVLKGGHYIHRGNETVIAGLVRDVADRTRSPLTK